MKPTKWEEEHKKNSARREAITRWWERTLIRQLLRRAIERRKEEA